MLATRLNSRSRAARLAVSQTVRKALARHDRLDPVVIDGSQTNNEAIVSCDITNHLQDRSPSEASAGYATEPVGYMNGDGDLNHEFSLGPSQIYELVTEARHTSAVRQIHAARRQDRNHPVIPNGTPFALNAAISIGPTENSPAPAFSVSARRYPPAELMCRARCRMQATTIAAASGPIVWQASSYADGETPSLRQAPLLSWTGAISQPRYL